jgi:hypothetical protein
MEMRIREIKKEDAQQLLSVYRRFAKEYVGLASRDIKTYKRLLRKKENMGWVALNQKGNLIGYVTARFDKRARHARIVEIVIDPDKDFEKIAKPLVNKAYNSLLEKNPAKITAGSIRNPNYTKIFPELGFFDIESTGVFMYTILDVPKFLAEISPILANRLKQLKQWKGLLQLQCEEHSLFIKKQQEKIEKLVWTNQIPNLKITLSRELLTKLLFGIADSVGFLKKGQLDVETTLNEKELSQILAVIFPKKQFLIMDFW